jgi:pentatricopeptide repeat protein
VFGFWFWVFALRFSSTTPSRTTPQHNNTIPPRYQQQPGVPHSLLRLLQYAGIPLDVAVLTRAISACGAAKEPGKALGLLQEMHKRVRGCGGGGVFGGCLVFFCGGVGCLACCRRCTRGCVSGDCLSAAAFALGGWHRTCRSTRVFPMETSPHHTTQTKHNNHTTTQTKHNNTTHNNPTPKSPLDEDRACGRTSLRTAPSSPPSPGPATGMCTIYIYYLYTICVLYKSMSIYIYIYIYIYMSACMK